MKTKKQKTEKKLFEEIEIPQEISAIIKNNQIIMKKNENEICRNLSPKINVVIDGNKILLSSEKNSKNEKKIFGSIKAHIKNMFNGLNEPFIYRLQIASVHFPITANYDKDKNELVIKNFLGEKKDRRIKLIPGVEVKINKDIIELESTNIEKAGQAASNIEKGTKIRKRDRRIFQDGVFIIEKPGRNYL